MQPQTIGRYQIQGELGRGGMGVVYRAYDPQLAQVVAVKVLSRALLHDTTFQARFRREIATLAALNHAAIVPIYASGEHEDQPYMADFGIVSLSEATATLTRSGVIGTLFSADRASAPSALSAFTLTGETPFLRSTTGPEQEACGDLWPAPDASLIVTAAVTTAISASLGRPRPARPQPARDRPRDRLISGQWG